MRLATRILLCLNGLFPKPDLSRYRDEYSYASYQQRHYERDFAAFYRHLVDFRGKRVVDIGCGHGGKTTYAACLGPAWVLGVDIDPGKLVLATQFARQQEMDTASCHFLVGDGARLPLADECCDLVISEDGFEHFPDPAAVLGEVNRVLLPAGHFLIHFATYYTQHGPHLYNFIRVPRAHYFFSDAVMIEATRQVALEYQREATDTWTPTLETPMEQAEREIHQFGHFINRMTLKRFKEILTRSSDWKLVVFHRYCTTRWEVLFLELPYLEELCGWLICVLEKVPGAAISYDEFLRARVRALPRLI